MSDAERCVACGEVIPDGRQVCPKCGRIVYKMENKKGVGGMVQIENRCVMCPEGSGYLGHSCPKRHEEVMYCDECGDEIEGDEYFYADGKELCESCLLDLFRVTPFGKGRLV